MSNMEVTGEEMEEPRRWVPELNLVQVQGLKDSNVLLLPLVLIFRTLAKSSEDIYLTKMLQMNSWVE